MARLDLFQTADMTDEEIIQLTSNVRVTPTEIYAELNGSSVLYTGNFNLSSGLITSGTVYRMETQFNYAPFYEVNDLNVSVRSLANAEISGSAMTVYNLLFNRDDLFTGSDGSDHLLSLSGDDIINAGPGNDTIDAGLGNDVINGEDGNDVVEGLLGQDTFHGGSGTDLLRISSPIEDISFTASGEAFRITTPSNNTVETTSVENFSFNGNNFSQSDLNSLALSRGLEIHGDTSANVLSGSQYNDKIFGMGGNDSILSGSGLDTIIGGAGDDTLIAGEDRFDTRDFVYGGDGDDYIEGGYGNDELRGDAGNDTISGGFGADKVIGGAGDDDLTGGAFGDQIFGGDGSDFINGGFGSDLLNGGGGADRFYHLGIADHGSDWIQDFDATEDVLIFGGSATVDQFQINRTATTGAGDDEIDEAFVIYRPTGQIIWALVDGGQFDALTMRLDGSDFDLS